MKLPKDFRKQWLMILNYLDSVGDKDTIANTMMLWLGDHFGIDPKTLATYIIILSTKNSAMANKKVLNTIMGKKS